MYEQTGYDLDCFDKNSKHEQTIYKFINLLNKKGIYTQIKAYENNFFIISYKFVY